MVILYSLMQDILYSYTVYMNKRTEAIEEILLYSV